MTIETLICDGSYVADGTANPRTIGFPVADPSYLRVEVDGVPQTLGTDFLVDGDWEAGDGRFLPQSAWASGAKVHYFRETPLKQAAEIPAGRPLPSRRLERQLDHDVMRIQEIAADLGRGFRVPRGETAAPLPAKADRAGRYLVGLPDGGIGMASGTGGDAALREDLAAPTGTQLAGYRRPGLGLFGSVSSQEAVNKRKFDIRDYDDIDLDGNNDNAATLQKAFLQSVADKQALESPGGQLLVGSSLNVPSGFSMLGTSRSAKGQTATRLIFADDAQLIHGDGVGDYEEGFLYRDIVVGNVQPPVPGSGSWDAADAVPIFVMDGAAQLDLQNVLFYGASRGVHMAGGGSIGRLNMENCGGQIFFYLVDIDLCADVPIIHNCRVWPFWSDTKPVNNFSCANADAFILKRVDTPIFSNPTTIAVRSGFRFANNAYGKTTKALISNPGFDYATTNIWFDDTSDGAYAWISNLSAQANNSNGALANVDGVTPRRNVLMEGVNCSLGVSGCDLGGASGSAVEVKGTSNEATFDGFVYVHSYGETPGNTDPCFQAGATSRVFLPDRIRTDAPGAGALAGGAGRVDGVWLNYVPSVTPQGGALTGVAIADAKFIRKGTKVSARVTLTFTNAGSATGYIRISAPVAVDNTFTAAPVNISTSQLDIAVSILGNPGFIQIQKVGGGNVAVTGETISVSFEYEAPNG